MYVEDLKRGTNKGIGPKDIFEMGSNDHRRGMGDQSALVLKTGSLTVRERLPVLSDIETFLRI